MGIALLTLFSINAFAQSPTKTVSIAVAANFTPAMKEIQKKFETATSATLVISYGSSGKFYTQIKNGAPFEIFLSADVERPEKLEGEKETVAGTRFTYAVGQLVLWSATPGLVDDKGDVLKGDFKKLSIADPKAAPYGAAAQEALQSLKMWDKVSERLVQGVDIAQAHQFVASGAAELGFVALSQVKTKDGIAGSAWMVPANLYKPISQQAVLLNKGKDNPTAKAFLEYLKSKEARGIIEGFGYKPE
ncbi:TPA: molybdate ABC transporter substrate-binding protein [Candidatus Sumerlaeota bacterium]|nr:molybdate ABC transporter substrate-binding protein [Candidatus Sumerlaeota bacterium]